MIQKNTNIKKLPVLINTALALSLIASSLFLLLPANAVTNSIIPEFTQTYVNSTDVGDLDRFFGFDVNGDNANDLILSPFGGSTGGSIRVFDSLGDGTFAAPDDYDTTGDGITTFQGAYNADVDDDGDMDFMAPGVGAANSLLFINDGTGTFTTQTLPNALSNPTAGRIPVEERDPNRFAGFADVDGDDDLDYVATDYAGDDWAVYLYNGTTYTETVYNNTYALGPVANANYGWLTDIDDDDDYDVVQYINSTTAGTDVQFNIWENDGVGVFTEVDIFTADPTTGVHAGNFHAVLDIDGDDDKDIISAGNETGNFIVHRNNGSNDFSAIQTINYDAGDRVRIHYSDLDNDGDFDIGLWDSNDDDTRIYHNDGMGVFSFSSDEPISYGRTTQDFNSDGQEDIISISGHSTSLGTDSSVQFGNGPFSFDPTVYELFDYGEEYNRFRVDDYTGDGFEDILITESDYYVGGEAGDENKFTLFLNTDNDDDGLSNDDEASLGSDSTNPDSDGDGVTDGLEVAQGGSPTNNDDDGDGVLTAEEEQGPNSGDANGDGTPDYTQSEVASRVNPNADDEYTTLELDDSGTSCDQVSELDFVTENSLTAGDDEYEYPLGLFDFDVACSSSGGSANISYIFDQNYDTADWTWRKYDPGLQEYVSMDDIVVFGTANIVGTTKTVASFSITDGGLFDDDGLANGLVVDPSGPAVLSELSETGAETRDMIITGAALVLAALTVAKYSNKRRYVLR